MGKVWSLWTFFFFNQVKQLQTGREEHQRPKNGPHTQLISITSILTNGRPERQTERPLGHMVGVCPGALRTLSSRAQVPSIFPRTAPAPTALSACWASLAATLGLRREDLFPKTDLHGRMSLNSQKLEFDGKQQKVRGKTGTAFKSKWWNWVISLATVVFTGSHRWCSLARSQVFRTK